jgi:hypothetical protein
MPSLSSERSIYRRSARLSERALGTASATCGSLQPRSKALLKFWRGIGRGRRDSHDDAQYRSPMFPNDVTATHDFESLDKAMGGFDALREAMGHAYRREPQRERKDSRVMALTGDALCSLRAPSLVVCALNRRVHSILRSKLTGPYSRSRPCESRFRRRPEVCG